MINLLYLIVVHQYFSMLSIIVTATTGTEHWAKCFIRGAAGGSAVREGFIEMVVFDGERILTELPESVMRIFRRAGIENPFHSPVLETLLSEHMECGNARNGGNA